MNDIIISVIRVALATLATRIVVFVSLCMQFGLACWCMYQPDPLRLITLGLFGVTVFLPVLFRYYPKIETPAQEPIQS